MPLTKTLYQDTKLKGKSSIREGLLKKMNRIIFRIHAVKRMFQRRISEKEVQSVLENGEIIESYPEDTPYPSRLILGWVGSRPLHVVVNENSQNKETIVITVYEPNREEWAEGFKRRKNL